MRPIVFVIVFAACGSLTPPKMDSGVEPTGGGGGATGGGTADAGTDCETGFHRCGDHCAADDSVNECGPGCETCPASGGIATCVQNACDFACGPGQSRCNGQCVTEDDQHCGSTCEQCSGDRQCLTGTCQLQCPAGEFEVDGRCTEGRELAAGQLNACVRHDGGVVCWGPGSTGMLGRGAYDGDRSPDYVSNLGNVASLALGSHYACVLLPTGAVRCWGDNMFGQVGNAGTQSAFTPALTINADVTTIAAGWRHACATFNDGGVSCWGAGTSGQLGNGTTPPGVRSPQSVPLDSGVQKLFAGGDGTWAITNNGLRFWGNDSLGEFTSTPKSLVVTDGGVKKLVAATNHGCVIRADTRTLECWGRGAEGQLGRAITGISDQPVREVPSLGAVSDVCTGLNFTCALVDDGGVRCFGNGTNGELGGGNFSSSSSPVVVDSLPTARQIACHHQFVCAQTNDGVYCWGDNSYGQLGAASPVNSASPVRVPLP